MTIANSNSAILNTSKIVDFRKVKSVFEIGGGFGAPEMGVGGDVDGYGASAKQAVRDNYGSNIGFALRGEMVVSEHCYCEIDPEVKDKWGIPVLKFHWKWSEEELNQTAHGLEWGEKLIKAMGGVVTSPQRTPEEAILAGGQIIHEVGTTRMGDDPATSVTNKWGRTWDVDNLYIMDGGVFASNPHKNCTITILTLAMKNSAKLVENMKMCCVIQQKIVAMKWWKWILWGYDWSLVI